MVVLTRGSDLGYGVTHVHSTIMVDGGMASRVHQPTEGGERACNSHRWENAGGY